MSLWHPIKGIFRGMNRRASRDVPVKPGPERTCCEGDLAAQWIYPVSYTEPRDVFIASYPKSGVTWLQHMTAALIYGLDAARVPDILVQTLMPDLHAFKFYLRTGRPVIMKTHDLPRPEMRRVVHLIRDGRDAMVSYHAMFKNQGFSVDFMDMVKKDASVYPCDWGTHCAAWMENRHGADILRIRYEDLKAKPEEALGEYCQFCGIPADEGKIRTVVEQAAFAKMQLKEKEQGWGPNDSVMSGGLFVRRGQVGSFRDEMPEDVLEAFERRHAGTLEALGYSVSSNKD